VDLWRDIFGGVGGTAEGSVGGWNLSLRFGERNTYTWLLIFSALIVGLLLAGWITGRVRLIG
jgi:hypothetical protein